ncbi:MAG: SDR family oxidoreductase [Chloroflexaceae bacterium]|jgi:NAD(P)-dependent dehydrogenase (short-subunit alcohol dehydrogenase family)|nr:SDR family oxidoreductase [Chloroflexaceae bacterium]
MAGRLAGKVALITGTAGGQGRAAALLFAREGAKVAGCDLKLAENQETARMVRDAGGEMLAHGPVDLGDEGQARAWIDAAVTAFGGCDILYNNASAPKFAPFGEMSSADWHFTIRNELDLIFYACRYAWPHLVRRGGGVIINTASRVALVGTEGAGDVAHAAAKGAIVAMTRQLAAEGAMHNIRVNSISPGVIDSPATAEPFKIPQVRAAAARLSLLNTIGTAEDVAHCALYLASDEARFVTGANLVIDGGSTIRNSLLG